YHVGIAGSHNIRKPLIDALDRVIGQDDLVAVMTPEMSASDITFARKTTTIEGFLTRYWTWGERYVTPTDPEDQELLLCYPANVAAALTDRRHEKRALGALHELVGHLGGLREERKAVLAITEGWLLYRPNLKLLETTDGRIPTGATVGVEPQGGKLTTRDRSNSPVAGKQCETD